MIQIAVYFILILALTVPMGHYLSNVFEGHWKWLNWLEKPIYRLLGKGAEEEQDWKKYASSLVTFSLISMLATYALLRLQGLLPLNPQHYGMAQMPEHLAFNTAASFTTNTNWQSYSPELTVSYFSNMVALAFQNWASAAVGISVAVAVVRGLARHKAHGIGNFWVDTVRGTLYVLLPLCLVGALIYVLSGVPQTFEGPKSVSTIEGAKQVIALGPVASQEVIKQLGTNGGGFFNANSAHPFENPTPFADLFTKLLIFLIPAGLTYMFGKAVGNARQGWAIFAAMSVLFLAGAVGTTIAEQKGNPSFAAYGVETPNMEGKETRFGIAGSALFATITTDASCGAVNSMHDSYTPMGGMVTLFNILTGEVIFGGVGSGLYGMLVFAIIAVFVAGLMVGRTPEFLGKKIGRFEVQMAMVAVLAMAASILATTALGSVLELPKEGWMASANTYVATPYGATDSVYGGLAANTNNPGAHGFSELLYTFASGTGNNGSAFAGITANTPVYNVLLGIAMIVGRFMVIIPVLAIAGHMSNKRASPTTAGTFPTDSATFTMLLIGVVVIVGALTFFPALALGPIVEQLQMTGGR